MREALALHITLQRQSSRLDFLGVELSWDLLRGDFDADADVDAEPDEQERAGIARVRLTYELLHERIETMESMGVQVREVIEGRVDFRTWLDGHTEAALSWRLGEPTIEWFHDVDEENARHSVFGHRFCAERESILAQRQ
jgi:hypothetical protein